MVKIFVYSGRIKFSIKKRKKKNRLISILTYYNPASLSMITAGFFFWKKWP